MTKKSKRVFGQGVHRAGLYACISTYDQQTLPMQVSAMREYASRRGWEVALVIEDIASGASVRKMREQIMDAATRREIDIVLVWKLDRWGRSVSDLIISLQDLQAQGVGFVSVDLPPKN